MGSEKRDYLAIAEKYQQDIIDGTIPACLQVRQMCQRQKKDLARKRFPYVWKPKKGERVCRFMELLRHVKGQWAGQPFVMSPWQVFITMCLFSWQHKDADKRRFREFFLLVPRKNGKTFWAAAVALYGLLADHEAGAEIYCGANSRDQANEVFRPAKQMLERDEELRLHFGAECFASNIHVHRTGNKFEPVIRNVRDGASPHFAICDELHEAENSRSVDAFSTGMGAREQPLLIIISTAGVNLHGPCYERQKEMEQVLAGTTKNDLLFGTIYTADRDDDWEDAATWVKANPNYGVSVSPDYIQSKIIETKNHVSRRNINLCKHLNIWNASNVAFFDMKKWGDCAIKGLSEDDFIGEQCWLGLDLASKIDIAALILLFKKSGEYYMFSRFYLPKETINRPENNHYQGWAYDDKLIPTPGTTIDFDYIEEEIRKIAENFDLQEIAYDPFQATQLSTHLAAEGLPMVEMRPTFLNFSEPMKELESLILEEKIHHNGDPVLQWMASNVTVKVDGKDNIYPEKEHRQNKIDGIVALIMALGRSMVGEVHETSVYEERGLIFL